MADIDNLPLTDPAHPLHRVAPTETAKEPVKADAKKATATTTAKRKTKDAAPKTAKPTATARKPHEPSTIVSTEANPSKSIVPPKYKVLYAAHQGTNGDNVAMALKAMEQPNEAGRPSINWSVIQEIAKANGIDVAKWEHLNNGQKRMNLGNALRGMVKAGKSVVIGKKRIANIRAAEPVQQAA